MDRLQRILIATDAWHPQVNGVVRTLDTTITHLQALGHDVMVVHPGPYRRLPVPFYPEVELCFPVRRRIRRQIDAFRPDAVHISTEGPIGSAVRRLCLKRRWRFSTCYHTKFPEYLRKMLGVPTRVTYWYLRRFHRPAHTVMVATPSLEAELRQRGFRGHLGRWSRGVDIKLFYPRPKTFPAAERPILMCVGRVSKEKNLDAFLRLKVPGTKYVVGDGPYRETLQDRYPDAKFLGYLRGEALAEAYANADVFVFPSQTDTFGLVVVEALASGVPVAGYPVVGPIDIINSPAVGAVDADLGRAVERALAHGDPEACTRLAQEYTWENCTKQFIENLVFVHTPEGERVRRLFFRRRRARPKAN